MRRILNTAALAVVSIVASAQTPDAPSVKNDSFDVAAIKPGDPSDRRMMIGVRPGGRFQTMNVPVAMLIRQAYEVQDFQIVGLPEWAKTDRYNVDAKSEDLGDPMKMTQEQRDDFSKRLRAMLQNLLADRFSLKLHRETKEMPVYNLVVAKNGPKVKASPAPADGRPRSQMRMGRGQLSGEAVNISGLVRTLSNQIGRTVIDKTGLTGQYDFNLEWTPDPGQMNFMGPPQGPPGAPSPNPPDPSGPSLFTAIQEQLGLRLQAAKGPVEVLVIDHLEKPSAN